MSKILKKVPNIHRRGFLYEKKEKEMEKCTKMKTKVKWDMIFVWLIAIPLISFSFWYSIYKLAICLL